MTTTKSPKIDRLSVDNFLWSVQRCLMLKHGTEASYAEIAPLEWYISTGRASCEFLRLLVSAKPFMLARKLHQGGTYEEALARIKKYIGYT